MKNSLQQKYHNLLKKIDSLTISIELQQKKVQDAPKTVSGGLTKERMKASEKLEKLFEKRSQKHREIRILEKKLLQSQMPEWAISINDELTEYSVHYSSTTGKHRTVHVFNARYYNEAIEYAELWVNKKREEKIRNDTDD